ncbi:hypothetical protein PCL_07981 [Purpureocillium lilacinum]|uniref:Uncharacterized protein n=1 Tax=Purpureocillium lilacinum TaxID=33203 RepID=A0A2U3EJI7_PURLI|nr:hypothetical protein PCL_07981 [Purpureocillium lilacinum]
MHVCTKIPAARWPSAPSPPLLLIRVSPRSWPAPPPSPVKREGLQQTQSRHTRSSSLPPSDARARHIDGAHEWEAASRPAGRRACDPGGGGGGGHATIQGHIVSRRVVQQMGSAGAWLRTAVQYGAEQISRSSRLSSSSSAPIPSNAAPGFIHSSGPGASQIPRLLVSGRRQASRATTPATQITLCQLDMQMIARQISGARGPRAERESNMFSLYYVVRADHQDAHAQQWQESAEPVGVLFCPDVLRDDPNATLVRHPAVGELVPSRHLSLINVGVFNHPISCCIRANATQPIDCGFDYRRQHRC